MSDNNSVLLEYRGGYAIMYNRTAEKFEVGSKRLPSLRQAQKYADANSISGAVTLNVPVIVRKPGKNADSPEFTKATLVGLGQFSRRVMYADGTQEVLHWYRNVFVDEGNGEKILARLTKENANAYNALRTYEMRMAAPTSLEALTALSKPVRTKKPKRSACAASETR